MSGLYTPDFVEDLRRGLVFNLDAWGCAGPCELRLLNLSENATFLLDDPQRRRKLVVRIYRPGYHTLAEIQSELAWIEALQTDQNVRTPAIQCTQSGECIHTFQATGSDRHAVAFAFMAGSEPSPSDADLPRSFETLGALSAHLHTHAKSWKRPANFTRKTWTLETAFGDTPLWGEWRNALGLQPSGQRLLEALLEKLFEKLSAYGSGDDRFGLIHADLRLANLLIEEDCLGVIDFDDCGFGWYFYDFAAAISFYEHLPIIPQLQTAWLTGYRSIAPVSEVDEAMFPTFILFRRLLLTAWIASHAETETARQAGHAAFTEGTLRLAERYLRNQ